VIPAAAASLTRGHAGRGGRFAEDRGAHAVAIDGHQQRAADVAAREQRVRDVGVKEHL